MHLSHQVRLDAAGPRRRPWGGSVVRVKKNKKTAETSETVSARGPWGDTCSAGGCRSSSGPSPPVSLIPPACLVSWASPCAAATAVDQGHPASCRSAASGQTGRAGGGAHGACVAERRGPAEGRGLGDPCGPRAHHVRVRRAPGPNVCVCEFLLRRRKMLTDGCLAWSREGRSACRLLLLLFATSQEEEALPGEPVVSARALHACVVPFRPSHRPARLQVVIAITGFGKFKGVDENPTQRYRRMPD